jgi:hypothetical protein
MNIVFDIETLPGSEPWVLLDIQKAANREKSEIRAPSNYKDPEKIAEYIAAKCAEIDRDVEAKYRKTALSGARGEICVIGYVIDDQEPITLAIEPEDEEDLIRLFFEDLHFYFDPSNRFKFIGHNILGFDLRFLYQRAMVYGIKPPPCFPINPRPGSEFVYDTMIEWAGWGNRISLDRLGLALGLGGKGDFDGSMVYDTVKAGDINRVAEYCKQDVMLTRAIYNRMTFR